MKRWRAGDGVSENETLQAFVLNRRKSGISLLGPFFPYCPSCTRSMNQSRQRVTECVFMGVRIVDYVGQLTVYSRREEVNIVAMR